MPPRQPRLRDAIHAVKLLEKMLSTEMITDFKERGTKFMPIHKTNKGKKGEQIGNVWRNYQINTADGIDTIRLIVDELWELDMGSIKVHFSYWINCSPTKRAPETYTVCSRGMVQEGDLCGMPLHITGKADNKSETMAYKVNMDMGDIKNWLKNRFSGLPSILDDGPISSIAELKRLMMPIGMRV